MKKSSRYFINDHHEFVIRDYNTTKPFSSFLPAISGLHGKPMWVYYVNRGQCIATFGVNNKDYSIMEFQPANKAYRQTALQGFRTFLKIRDAKSGSATYYEPFQDPHHAKGYDVSQCMYITSYDLRLEEINRTLGFKIEVTFCTLPDESLSSLIRKVAITNLSDNQKEFEILDGMPAIIPYYIHNIDMKNESNLRQAWMGVDHYETIPFYKIHVLPYDTPETVLIEGGNFYLNFSFQAGKTVINRTIIEPELIFGNVTDFTYPEKYMADGFDFPEKQVNVGVTPCGFGHKRASIKSGESDITYTFIGCADQYERLTEFVSRKLTEDYVTDRIRGNRSLAEGLKKHIFTSSSSEEFDLYCGQTFMDNFLRGGYPVEVGKGKHTFYVYSRKHGDLEREYNFFQVDSTYYSQGNSNFRDVNQNRRNDVYFFPHIGDANIKTFFDLIQLDGYNPLVLKGSRFTIADPERADGIIREYIEEQHVPAVTKCLSKPYTPGSLLGFLEMKGIKAKMENEDAFLNELLSISIKEDLADFQEGYWVDHWIYNIDLLEQYLDIFPDRAAELLFNKSEYSYYDNYEVVLPRNRKYVLTSNGVRQFGALAKNSEKEKLIQSRTSYPNRMRDGFGKGEVYYCTLISKIVTLIINKIASLDPEGVGIEMEANKPGWCDALNGLPAIIGSSVNESFEIKRLAGMILEAFNTLHAEHKTCVKVPEEVHSFFNMIYSLLDRGVDGYEYWDRSSRAREEYRNKTVFGISGQECEIGLDILKSFLEAVCRKVDSGMQKAFNVESGVYYTYFINEVTEYESVTDENGAVMTNDHGMPYVKALKFRQRPIPYFLEGPVHVLRMERDTERARKLYHSIRDSGLYDAKLDMYKVNDNIMEETKEIGRQNVFPRGWLENEAVFLHMEYKYFLELLRCGLYKEFFHYLRNAVVPFLDPEVYGRSILENSSFIASSVHPDEKVHGRGFVSRLTGASAEFLSMWRYMTVGKKPFFIDRDKGLCFELKPVIPGWLFTDKPRVVELSAGTEAGSETGSKAVKLELHAGAFAFMLLGKIPAVYHNESRKDIYGDDGIAVDRIEIFKNGLFRASFTGGVVPEPYSRQIRNGDIDRMEIYFKYR